MGKLLRNGIKLRKTGCIWAGYLMESLVFLLKT